MEPIYILPLKILAVVVATLAIGLFVAWYRKRRLKKKLSTSKSTPLPALEERSGFEEGVIG